MQHVRELRMTAITGSNTPKVWQFAGDCTVTIGTDAGNHVYLDGVGESHKLVIGVDNQFVLHCPPGVRLFADELELSLELDGDRILLPEQMVSVVKGFTTITFDILP